MHKMNSRLFSIHTYTLNVKIVTISGRHGYLHIFDTFLYFPFFYIIFVNQNKYITKKSNKQRYLQFNRDRDIKIRTLMQFCMG